MIRLEEITKENLDAVLALGISNDQKRFVSTAAFSLAQAYVYRDTAFPFAVYADDMPVGFVMMGYYEARNQYTLWKLFIDEKHQGKGYGRKALELGIEFLREKRGAKEIYTGVIPENAAARELYHSAGFVETGLEENGMLELKLLINKQ